MNRLARIVTVGLACVGTASLGIVVVQALPHRLPLLLDRVAASTPIAYRLPDPQLLPAADLITTLVPRHMCGAMLDVTMLLADGRRLRDARTALPTGSRFQLRLHADREGTADVWNLDSTGWGDAVPVWRGRLRARAATLTPSMRLVGGNSDSETLRIVFRPSDGADRCGSADQVLHL